MDIFQVLFYQPTFNLMVFFSNIFGNIGWAIIAIALISKLITLSMTSSQIKNAAKSKQLQTQMTAIKKQYANNQEKQAQELAKLQATALPGQLGGCLSVIIFLVLFIQIRSVILDLVNKGYHAFNVVAYDQSFKKNEDSVKLPAGYTILPGKNTLDLKVVSSDNVVIDKVYDFTFVKDKNVAIEAIKADEANLTTAQKQAQTDNTTKQADIERASDISIYNKDLDAGLTTVPLSQFLIFTTESVQARIITDNNIDLTFFIRPPSNQTIDYTQTQLTLNGVNMTDNTTHTQGDVLNLTFAGMNLSRVATDFGVFNLAVTWPYILVAIISGITQYFVSKLYAAATPTAAPADDDAKKKEQEKLKNKNRKDKDEKPAEEDFATVMAQTTQQMNFLFPILTVMMSLGYLGGATFIPAGVTLFWTAQNGFVIIQQMISQRKKLIHRLKTSYAHYVHKFNLVKATPDDQRPKDRKN